MKWPGSDVDCSVGSMETMTSNKMSTARTAGGRQSCHTGKTAARWPVVFAPSVVITTGACLKADVARLKPKYPADSSRLWMRWTKTAAIITWHHTTGAQSIACTATASTAVVSVQGDRTSTVTDACSRRRWTSCDEKDAEAHKRDDSWHRKWGLPRPQRRGAADARTRFPKYVEVLGNTNTATTQKTCGCSGKRRDARHTSQFKTASGNAQPHHSHTHHADGLTH